MTIEQSSRAAVLNDQVLLLQDGHLTYSPLSTLLSGLLENATLRNTATRCNISNARAAAYNYMTGATYHVHHGSPTNTISIRDANWAAIGGSESPSASPMQISRAVEFPAGVFTPVTYGGASVGTISAGGEIASDPVTLPRTLLDNSQYRLHLWYYCASGVIYFSVNGIALLGERAAYSSSPIANTVASGGAATAPIKSDAMMYPLEVLALSNKPSIMLFGDSRAVGFGDNGATSFGFGDIGEVARMLGPAVAYTKFAVYGEQLSQFLAANALRMSHTKYHTHAVTQYGINDIQNGGATAATMLTMANSMIGLFTNIGMPFWWGTCYPIVTTTNSPANYASNQVVSPSNGNRAAWNDMLRAKTAGSLPLLAGTFDNSIVVEPVYDGGNIFVLQNGTQATPDGVHLNDGGNALIARARTLDPRAFV